MLCAVVMDFHRFPCSDVFQVTRLVDRLNFLQQFSCFQYETQDSYKPSVIVNCILLSFNAVDSGICPF